MALKEITIPDLGGASDVTVIEILVKPGDVLAADTSVVTLESDKATMEVPTTESGIIQDIRIKVGDKLSSGSVLMTLKSEEPAVNAQAVPAVPVEPVIDSPAHFADRDDPDFMPTEPKRLNASRPRDDKFSSSEETAAAPDVLANTITQESSGDVVHAGPGVRRMARELGVELTNVKGTGPKHRILKEDIQGYIKQQLMQKDSRSASLPPLPVVDYSKFGSIQIKALSRIKKISGNYLQRNWAMIPHVTQFGQADITALEEFRQSQKTLLEKQQIKLTPLVFAMKAVVSSLKAFPHFNASLDTNNEQLILKNYFHIGVAVDTPEGLVVPVIRDVDKRGFIELAKDLAHVSEKARNKQLTPMDMQGGCFSISSLGGIGGSAFTPIINYPEVAILGLSKTSYQPVYSEGSFIPRLMLPLSLSYDHRVIDGAEGARFMVHLTRMLSDIRNLLL